MTYKAILTHIVADRGCAARLRMAQSVARVLSAEVIGLGAQAPWPFSDARDGRGREFEQLLRNARDDVASAQRAFQEAFAGSDITGSWREEIAYPNEVLARQARVADLVLAYRTTGGAVASAYAAPDSLVMEAGLPVLLMPAKEMDFKADSILLAWKNTREARRTISVTLPLLARASRVLVAAVCGSGEIQTVERELTDVGHRLARHGVKATTLAEVDAPGSAGRKLLRIADTDGSDLVIAGGYGHSKLREWVMGGVSRDLIADGRRYVLLNH